MEQLYRTVPVESSEENSPQRLRLKDQLLRYLGELFRRFRPIRQHSRELSRQSSDQGFYVGCGQSQSSLPTILESSGEMKSLKNSCTTIHTSRKAPAIGDSLYYDGFHSWKVVNIRDDGMCDIRNEWLNNPEFGHARGSRFGLSCAIVQHGILTQRENDEKQIKAVQKALPRWALHEAAVCQRSMSGTVGPAVPCVRAAVVASLVTQLGTFALAYAPAKCVDLASEKGSTWILGAMLPTLFGRAFAEWKALTYVLAEYLKRAPLKLAGVEVPFKVWLAFNGMFSQMSFLDMGTDSLFTGTWMRMLECDEGVVADIWEKTWQGSSLGLMPTPSLCMLLVGSWSLSLLQIIVPLFRTTRRSDLRCATVHELGDGGEGTTLCGSLSLRHASVLFGLADAGGMVTLQSLAVPYNCCDIQDFPLSAIPTISRGLANQMLERIFLSTILENCVQLDLQSTLYAISLAASRIRGSEECYQVLALFSLMVGILMSFFKLFEAKAFFEALRLSSQYVAQDDATEATKEANVILQWKGRMVVVGCLMAIASLFYTIVKLVMVHVCKDAMWNISGCVILQA